MIRIAVSLFLLLTLGVGGLTPAPSDAAAAQPVDGSPAIHNGSIDLADWDASEDGPVKLDGRWSFYWEQLLVPSDWSVASAPAGERYINVPGYWNDRVEGEPNRSANGYATYRLHISSIHSEEPLAIKLRNMYSSSAVWANGKLVYSAGRPGTDAQSTEARYTPSVVIPIGGLDGTLDLIIQTANFTYPRGGINNGLLLGTAEQLIASRSSEIVQDFIQFGALGMMAVYHLFLFALRRNDRTTLNFAIFCLCMAVRALLVNSRYILEVFPDMSFEWFAKLSYLTVYAGFYFLVAYVHGLFPSLFSSFIRKGYGLFSLLLIGAVLILDVKGYDRLLIPFEILTAAAVLYAAFVAVRAAKQRQSGSLLLIGGFLVIFATGLSDALVRKGGHFPALLSTGVLLFAFLQSLLLSMKFSRAFRQVEQLSERLMSLDKLKDEFLARTSHELRTPLHGIIGLAESLLDGPAGSRLSAAENGHLQLIRSSGQRLSHLVNDILDFSKLRNHEIQIHPVTVNVHQVVELVLHLLRPLAEGKGLLLINEVPAALQVRADENRLHQILHNLVGNATKFTMQGHVTVSARKQGRHIAICIKDTGIGIPPESLEAIFESFEQLDGANERGGGTGIGLSITKKLVELHGGEVRVESTPGIGSAFSFILPGPNEEEDGSTAFKGSIARISLHAERDQADRTSLFQPLAILSEDSHAPVAITEPHADGPLQMDSKKASEARPSVLIVDDDPVNLSVLAQYLGNGYDIRMTSSGHEAIGWIQAGYKPEIALLDVMMPIVSGFQICNEIRQLYNSGELPVLFLTAVNQTNDLLTAYRQGANDYMIKPIGKQELLARLALHLRIARWNASLEQEIAVRMLALEQTMEQRAQAMSNLSVLEERNRIARDIHDHVGHMLTASIVQLEAGLALFEHDAELAAERLTLAADLMRRGLQEMRRSVRMLTDTTEDTVRLEASLEKFIAEATRYAGITIEHRIEPLSTQLHPEQEKLVYRVLQEGITNGIRHGDSRYFQFELVERDHALIVKLLNSGVPYSSSMLGFGLATMKEAAEHWGGQFHIGAVEGQGCLLEIIFPLQRSDKLA
ncbi:ATP-binding protein [Paenibacillus sp. MMS18-CY102]|uniref:ATP-binding protein n=1 Tax=Paenibacillus sp. MMS18-CY102 TaxID=2682849 RepID=UPI0013654F25|nr:ATP-binding protein [Paenibacillus sp. MMS18-CY102]MWC27801.1 response regulator [Paenibacillus sp. MMS18-CY102]